jgi:hypothetical protein
VFGEIVSVFFQLFAKIYDWIICDELIDSGLFYGKSHHVPIRIVAIIWPGLFANS